MESAWNAIRQTYENCPRQDALCGAGRPSIRPRFGVYRGGGPYPAKADVSSRSGFAFSKRRAATRPACLVRSGRNIGYRGKQDPIADTWTRPVRAQEGARPLKNRAGLIASPVSVCWINDLSTGMPHFTPKGKLSIPQAGCPAFDDSIHAERTRSPPGM
jgi:hypothetical protein